MIFGDGEQIRDLSTDVGFWGFVGNLVTFKYCLLFFVVGGCCGGVCCSGFCGW